jgi:hypothetical protein
MPIDGGLRDKLAAGTALVARYRGAEHRAQVVAEEEGKVGSRLADGRVFKSPSAAGSAVMGGTACNGCPCGMELHARTNTRYVRLPSSFLSH